MKASSPPFPELPALITGLNAAMGGSEARRGRVTVLDRAPAARASTYPSEVVTCRIGDHGEVKLYCKYMAGLRYESYGHRGGVPYETEVYRHVLQSLPFSVPKFHGAYEDATSGDTWLILEYLDNGLRVAKGPQPETMLRAAHWIGQFHAINERQAYNAAISFLNTYGAEYYLGWVRRTFAFARSLLPRFPWLKALCEHAEEFVGILLSAKPTVIHGEYYPHNIL